MSRSLFVTGTDTGVGKTRIARALLQKLRDEGHSAAGFKPVASGAERTAQGLRNDDALVLQAASTPGVGYEEVNPWCFEPAIAPHLAAREAGVAISLEALDAAHQRLARRHDWVVVEGAGGWLVPLNAQHSFADWVGRHGWPVVLVVAMRLGCINHALLSAESIQRRTRLLGWIANVLPPAQERLRDNIDSLRAQLQAPLLATVPAGATAAEIATLLDGAALRA
ncbi:MAG: dethiobiotin synthase [Nevskia sp.]|nr:dethiobiotin synthase [Nevskia sp.]